MTSGSMRRPRASTAQRCSLRILGPVAVEDRAGGLSTITLAGGIVAALGLTLSSAVLWVAAARVARPGGLTVGEAVVLYDAHTTIGATVVSIGLAAWIGATGLVSLETMVFPAWLCWTSIAFAVRLLSPAHYVFEGLAAAWIVAVSVTVSPGKGVQSFARARRTEQAERGVTCRWKFGRR